MHVARLRLFRQRLPRLIAATACLLLGVLLSACRTPQPLPSVNLSEPGWQTRVGQAVWRPGPDKPEIAGELLVSHHPERGSVVQFIKTPFPLVTARKTARRWEVEFGPEGKRYSGRGNAPGRLLWLHLADYFFAGAPLPKQWSVEKSGEQWRFENRSTGEALEGYLQP